ncbi:MAG: sulfotransferase [Cyanobacteria bacterium P01_D01_bin.156]
MTTPGPSPIFIVGMPRSGTTLLTTILSGHPRIAISPETHFLTYWVPKYSHLDLSKIHDFETFWQALSQSKRFSYFDIDSNKTLEAILAKSSLNHAAIFTGWLEVYAERWQKPRWGEKTPLHYQHLNQLLTWFPNAQVLWMLRDPRAVTASLLKMDWASDYVHVHAQQWCQSTQLYERQWQSNRHVKLIRYEDLVQQPELTLKGICRFLNEDYSEQLLAQRSADNISTINRQGWALSHLNQTLKPLEYSAIDKWQRELWPAHIEIVDSLTGTLQKRYGYAEHTQNSLTLWANILLNLAKLRWKLERKLMVWRTRLLGQSLRRAHDIGAEKA